MLLRPPARYCKGPTRNERRSSDHDHHALLQRSLGAQGHLAGFAGAGLHQLGAGRDRLRLDRRLCRSDPGGAAEAPYTAVINWGDSTTDTATVSGSGNPFSYSFNGNHTYAQSGNYEVTHGSSVFDSFFCHCGSLGSRKITPANNPRPAADRPGPDRAMGCCKITT